MPIPQPQADESQSDFMARCMGNGTMVGDYPEQDQRAAVCMSTWEDAHKSGGGQLRVKTTAAPPPAGDPLQYVMSDASVDRMGDVIEPGGWQLENFRRNPVALFGHNPDAPIGTWRDVSVEGGELRGRLELMPAVSERLRELHAAVAAGVLRAVSVGFRPIEFEALEGSKRGGLRFSQVELVECSLVSVPANPNALAVAKALKLSRDTQRLIFGVSADQAQPAVNGRTGVPAATHPASGDRQMSTISGQIQQSQAKITTLRDYLNDHIATLGDDPDETALAKQDELREKITAEVRKLESFQAAEAALGATAEPAARPVSPAAMTIIPPQRGMQPRPFALPKREVKPGELLMNALIAFGKIDRFKIPQDRVLADYGWSDDVGVRTCLEWLQRAATNPATTTTTGWAAELVQTQYAEFLSQLLIKSIFRPLSAQGVSYTLGRYGQISLPVESATPTIAGSFVAEGAPIPVRQGAFTSLLLGLKKMAVITSFTRELYEHSIPNIDTQLRDMIGRHTSVALDSVLIDANPATAVRPAGLRNGVSGLTPTSGGGFTALVGDMKGLLGVLVAANSLRNPVWIMNDQQALSITFTQSSAGTGVFPFKNEVDAGRLAGYPIITSPTCPVTMVILVDAADFVSLAGDDPRFEMSDQATLHMEDTTPLPIASTGAPNTVAAPTRSMFQTDSIALRMIMPMNWAMRRAGLVSWVTGVTW
jgi:HK97 family phage major capsid protein/HK97 family phage prohead protease